MSGIAIKYTSIDTVVFDYIPFPISTHTTGITNFLETRWKLRLIWDECVKVDLQVAQKALVNRAQQPLKR